MNTTIKMGWLKHILDPFELLYISIAIATFTHTQYTSALYFEGAPPTDAAALNLWYFHGALIAIAIDIGMLLTSRFIASTTDRSEVSTLIAAFTVAALASFFTQLGYILIHTPVVTISEGVSPYWREALSKFIDARVVILPFLLPVMGTIYTVARIARTRRIMRQTRELAEQEKKLKMVYNPTLIVTRLADLVRILEEGQRPRLPEEVLPSGEWVDWEGLKFYDIDNGVWRGAYPNRAVMLATMKNMADRRRPKELDVPSNKQLPPETPNG